MTTTLSGILRDAAQKYPHRNAIEDPDRGNAISYADLVTSVLELSEVLGRHGARPSDRIGICAPKSIAVVAAIFAILEVRAAYVPVDPTAPGARNAGIFADCSVTLVVLAADLLPQLRSAWDGASLDVLEDLGNGLLLVRGVTVTDRDAREMSDQSPMDDIAYVLYTSGSTGKPKGVVHTHRSAMSFIDWCSLTFAPTSSDRFSSHAPFHFDLSIFDLYLPASHGATLVLIGDAAGKQPRLLGSIIAREMISIWYSTPSVLRLLSEYGRLDQADFSALRLVLFAGEVFPVKHFRALKQFWPHPEYFNLYGPTETNVCTFHRLPSHIPDGSENPYPIGLPCSGDRAIVVDEQGLEVPLGSEGELLISGGSVMREYWNLPEKTNDAFVADADATHWYKTGDFVTESAADGYIFCGRRDRMVKRRGYRVELGEIEAMLYRHPSVAEAAVIAQPDSDGGLIVTAFLSLATGSRPSLVAMKGFCATHLPSYMIPDRFMYPDALPRTSTDKVDYQRLREFPQ